MDRKMRTCHVITRMIVGGAQENTLLTMQGHLQKGHAVTLITGASPGPEGELLKRSCPPGLKIIEVPELIRELHPFKDWQAYRALRRIFRSEHYDVVHTHSSKAGILGRFAARREGVPFVVHTVHGQAFHPYQAAWKNRMYIVAERLAAQHCDRIYAVAQAMIDQCVAVGVAPREKYQVVYSGMDLQAFMQAQREPELRRQLGIAEDDLVVGKIARLFELKGHDRLVEAAALVIQVLPKVKFLLVGDGNLRQALEAQIAALGLQKNFIFAGLVSPSEVCRYAAQMDVLAHLSLREGLPRTAVQALAGAVPVVAYPLDGTPEVVINGETGFLCEPENVEQVADRLVALLQDKSLRKRLGKQGQALVQERFGWQRMADILESEYLRGLTEKGIH